MLRHIHTLLPGKRNWRRTYIVHFDAYKNFDLNAYVAKLNLRYALTVTKGVGTNFQSVEMRIRPRQLREMEKNLPDEVVMAFELKEPV